MVAEFLDDGPDDDEDMINADQMRRLRKAQREANIDPDTWTQARNQLHEIKLQVQLLEIQLFFAEPKNSSTVVPDRIDALYEFLSERQRFERALRSHKLDEDAR